LKANLDLFKLEGAGQLYVTTCIDDTDVQAFRSGTLTAPTLREKLSFKLGHTSSLACRQYRKCENGQTHLWLWSYNVDQQYIAGVYLIFFSFSFSYSHRQNGCATSDYSTTTRTLRRPSAGDASGITGNSFA
jgi:hypothetical protein